MAGEGFWPALDRLVAEHRLVIDRPAGSHHPRYPAFVYAYDYGYLEGTQAADGDGIDVWVGSATGLGITGVLCSVDMEKRDLELKILLDCTLEERERILAVNNGWGQAAILIPRFDSDLL